MSSSATGGNTASFGLASETSPGMVSTGAQSFGGVKTFVSAINTNISKAGTVDITSTGAGVTVGIHNTAGDDFNVGAGKLVVEGDTGFVGLGTISPDVQFSVVGTTTSATGIIQAERFGAEPKIYVTRVNGSSSVPTKTLSTDALGSYNFVGYQETTGTTVVSAIIGAVAAENFTSTAKGSYMYFSTSPIGGSPLERMRIDAAGFVGIGTLTPGAILHVNQVITSGSDFIGGKLILSRSWDNSTGNRAAGIFQWYDITDTFDKLSIGITSQVTGGDPATEARAKLTIREDGNVGIGTVIPLARLHASKVEATWATPSNTYGVTSETGNFSSDNTTVAEYVGFLSKLIWQGGQGNAVSSYAFKADCGTGTGGSGGWGSPLKIVSFYGRLNTTAPTQGYQSYYGLYLDTAIKDPSTSLANNYGVYSADTTAKNYFGGLVGIGTNAPTTNLHITSNALTAGGAAVRISGELNSERIQIMSTVTSAMLLATSGGGTIATPLATVDGGVLGYYQFGGHDGINFSRAAWIQGLADGLWSAANHGSHMAFYTTPNGSTSIAEKMRLTSAGVLKVDHIDEFTAAHGVTFNNPISSAGAKVLAPWTTGTVYPIGSYVSYTVNTNQTYVLVCQAAHTSGTYATDVGLGYWQMATPMKNWLINGGFDFSQRGQTTTAPATTAFVSDRWRNSLDSGAPAGGQTTVIPVGSPYPVRSRYWLLTVSPASGATGYRGIYQILETNRLLENTQVSVSFWVYATIGTTIYVRWVDGTNRNGTTAQGTSKAVTGAVGTKITVTFSGFQTDVNSLMWIYWSDANNQNVYIADVMLNEGPAPAAFQLAGESIGGELALCQRYYEKSYSPDVTPGTVTTAGSTIFRGATDSGPNVGGTIFYKVVKRYATTSISFWNVSGAANIWQAAQAAGSSTPAMNYQLEGTSSIGVFGTITTAWAPAYIYGHWAVDAEI